MKWTKNKDDSPSDHRPNPSERGVALVITLAFVLLLTGVVVAFFSRAMAERQVSNSSASATKASLLAEGVADSIISNFQQEIAVTSTASSFVTATGTSYYYTPVSSQSMLPQLSMGTAGGVSSWAPNLLMRSAHGAVFYSGTTSASTIEEGAVNVSSTTRSLNQRFVSLSRWNKHCLLSGTDSSMTPPTSGANAFAAPDWILVNRGGKSYTTATVPNTPTGLTWSATNTATVVGRYAYAVYHEGGLLDINVAGYPQAPNTTGTQLGYKPGLAYADLASILTSVGFTSGSASSLVDQMVGWRNYASIPTPGASYSTPSFSPASGSNYFKFVLSNTTGYLTVSGSTQNNQTDRMFTSRQEMIRFFQSGLNLGSGTNLNLLNYLTHFSRDLNQPSYAPPATRPKVQTQANGGNIAYSFDDTINPAFLRTRVTTTTAGARNDGSDLIKGEPLVKKRFALNRLAWITYLGPSNLHMADPSVQQTITALGGNPSDPNDPVYQFVQQGTAQRVYNYFGLSWVSVGGTNMWIYNHTGSAPLSTVPATGSAIKSLNDPSTGVITLNREPDFFELLKAAIQVGSLGKASTSSAAPAGTTFLAQYNRDISVDYQILQIGANIIDQFDSDGYPTNIYFDDGAALGYYGMYNRTLKGQMIHGVENLPYLNRLRSGILKASLPVPYGTTAITNGKSWTPFPDNGTNDSSPLTQTGAGLVMQFPELWNPHDWDSTNLNKTLGVVQPTSFRIIAETDPSLGSFNSWGYNNGNFTSTKAYVSDPSSAWFTTNFGSIAAPPARTLTAGNTEMDFSIPATAQGAALFREPTVLFKPNVPSPSALSCPVITTGNTGVPSVYIGASGASTGFKSAVIDPANIGDTAGQIYIGFYEGAFPLEWVVTSATGQQVYPVRQNKFTGAPPFMVRLQYRDASGNWVSYDEKYCPDLGFGDQIVAQQQGPFLSGIRGDGFDATIDPRTTRFSVFHHYMFNGYGWNTFPPYVQAPGWADTNGYFYGPTGFVYNQRKDNAAGAVMWDNGNTWASWAFPTSMGWWPGQTSYSVSNGQNGIRVGLMMQNNPQVLNDGRITANAKNTVAGLAPQFYTDADGVIRRATAAWVSSSATASGSSSFGLPMATANTVAGTGATASLTRVASQSMSRPIILNRPFRSVAELGYVFKDTPWKNVDFQTPESGDTALLDVFCTMDAGDSSAKVAGKVNLNTRQDRVLEAVLANAYQDELVSGASGLTIGATNGDPAKIASALVARTSGTTTNGQTPPSTSPQMLSNLGEIVGKWVSAQTISTSGATAPNNVNGVTSYDGFVGDTNLTNILGANSVLQRYREAVVRPLANVGSVRVWNLLIDLVAQTGRYPTTARNLADFLVEGEQHYWVHVAIDRYTGLILDKQIEVVKE